MARICLVASTLLVLLARTASAEASFWERVANPHRQRVESLVQRAQGELGYRPGASREAAARAEGWLREALRYDPDSFSATVLLGEAQARQGRGTGAAAAFARAEALARTPAEESWCALRAAVESSRAGRYAEALADYDQHLRLGEAQPTAYANSAEILMALGRLHEAQDRYREAIRLEGQGPAGRDRDENLALAYYGLAVALDRDEQAAAAREAVARALEGDPRLALLDAARDEEGGVFFVPPGDVHYYRGLALTVLARPREAAESFQRFLTEQRPSRYARRAENHLLALAAGGDENRVRARFRVAAAGTVRSDESLPAPLVDASLRARPGLFDPCLDDVPATLRESTRVAMDVDVDAGGVVQRVRISDEWSGFARCAEGRLRSGVRLSRPGKPVSLRLELVLGLRR
jgi:tetratricopeptide (TPR) repeat protein